MRSMYSIPLISHKIKLMWQDGVNKEKYKPGV